MKRELTNRRGESGSSFVVRWELKHQDTEQEFEKKMKKQFYSNRGVDEWNKPSKETVNTERIKKECGTKEVKKSCTNLYEC